MNKITQRKKIFNAGYLGLDYPSSIDNEDHLFIYNEAKIISNIASPKIGNPTGNRITRNGIRKSIGQYVIELIEDRELDSNESVIHKNGNNFDNRYQNLKVIPQKTSNADKVVNISTVRSNEIVKLYNSGLWIDNLSSKFHISENKIKDILKENNVNIRKGGKRVKYDFDSLFGKKTKKLMKNKEYSKTAILFFGEGYLNNSMPKYELDKQYEDHFTFLYTEGKKLYNHHIIHKLNESKYINFYFSRNGRSFNEQRWVMQLMLGRWLKTEEYVSHQDNNPKNNHPSNLFIKRGDNHNRGNKSKLNAKQIVAYYRSINDINKVAKEEDVTPATIRRILINNNLIRRDSRSKQFTNEQLIKMENLYNSGKSLNFIAKIYDVNVKTITSRLKSRNVFIRKGNTYV